ncbi:MAG TPA: hypothetical protein VMV80_04920 [Anaerolineales bacterium]|nr:hypothetical protein [Anaerolineales bacterium]
MPSLRTEIPREFIKKYLKASDVVLDAGGGMGIKRHNDGAALQEGHSGRHFDQDQVGDRETRSQITGK